MTTFLKMAIAVTAAIGFTGIAAAQPKADAKAPPKAPDAGAMPDMKPPAELASMAKNAAGTWKCKGQGMDHTMKMSDMGGTMTIKLDLESWWLHASFASNMGKEPFRFESFTTFDAGSKKWKRVMVESGGGWSSGEATVGKGGKVDWNLTSHSAMGEAMFRDHEDASDPKAGVKMWGEFSIDKGGSWIKVYEMTCQK